MQLYNMAWLVDNKEAARVINSRVPSLTVILTANRRFTKLTKPEEDRNYKPKSTILKIFIRHTW